MLHEVVQTSVGHPLQPRIATPALMIVSPDEVVVIVAAATETGEEDY
jgi:hypothetical protein